jgi:hypothetical protein
MIIQSGSLDYALDTEALARVPADASTSPATFAGHVFTVCPACRAMYLAANYKPAVCSTCMVTGFCSVCAGEHHVQACPIVLARLFAPLPEVAIDSGDPGRSIAYLMVNDRAALVRILRAVRRDMWSVLADAYLAHIGMTCDVNRQATRPGVLFVWNQLVNEPRA